MTWAHDDLANDLAEHLRGASDRLVWTDMQLGPAGSPRPDVYTVPCSFARFMPIAYECKISVADFRRDITAGKWSSYLRFSSGVIFAVPAGLINKVDVPTGCGLIVRSETGWRSLKGPTLRPVDNLPRDAWIKLLIDGVSRIRHGYRTEAESVWTLNRSLHKKVGVAVATAVTEVLHAENILERELARLSKAADDARDAYDKELARAVERAQRDAATVDLARTQLATALGLKSDARADTIAAAARGAVSRINENAEVLRLRNQLDDIKRALDATAIPWPHIALEAS